MLFRSGKEKVSLPIVVFAITILNQSKTQVVAVKMPLIRDTPEAVEDFKRVGTNREHAEPTRLNFS